MTRNQNLNLAKRTHSLTLSGSTRTSVNDDYLAQLPDLSGLRDDEKQHILNVLLRDENLRNKHLARFIQLRKEVAGLEQRQTLTSASECSLCQSTFGFLFNTGDTCPKCGAKVCKQCRLIYNVNDNGWLCKLCCKQMQLMSYSGEWVYSFRSNLRKDTVTASEMIRRSLSPAVSCRNLNALSSSDTDADENISVSGKDHGISSRSNVQQRNAEKRVSRMMVQNAIDEKKLHSIKHTVPRRPYHGPLDVMIAPPPPPSAQQQTLASNHQAAGSSDDVDSLFDQSTNYTGRTSGSPSSTIMISGQDPQRAFSMGKSTDSLNTMQNEREIEQFGRNLSNQRPVDCASVTSSEWGADDIKSEREGSIAQSKPLSKKRGSKHTLSSRMHLTGSMQSIRDAVSRLPTGRLSLSRTSLNSEKRSKVEQSDTLTKNEPTQPSINTLDEQSKVNSNATLLNSYDSKDLTRTLPAFHPSQSNDTVFTQEPVNESSISRKRHSSSRSHNESELIRTNEKKSATFGSVNNLDVIDSDDDIDGTFEKAKLGSQISIVSALSESKANYGLEISGAIKLKLTHAAHTGALDIFINQCTNLAQAKRNHTSDPYIKIYLLPDRSKNSKRKSSVKKSTTNPVYDEKFRYHVTKQEFEMRTIWISVWSESALGHNDFLGEIHIPLAHCSMDTLVEYQLSAQVKNKNLLPTVEPTINEGEIHFELVFIPSPKDKNIGTLRVHHIEGKAIFHGKNPIDAICKGLLMPDTLKRKVPTIRKGPAPKWEVPLSWDGIRRDNLRNTSIEISIWSQERFRKLKVAFVRLNLSQGHFDNKPVDWLDATVAEKLVWETFIRQPTQAQKFQLPLRPVTNQTK